MRASPPAPSGPLCSSWSWAGCLAAAYAILLTFGMACRGAPLPVRSHADSGDSGHPAGLSLPVRLCAAAGSEPPRLLLPGPASLLPCASGSAGSTPLTCPRP